VSSREYPNSERNHGIHKLDDRGLIAAIFRFAPFSFSFARRDISFSTYYIIEELIFLGGVPKIQKKKWLTHPPTGLAEIFIVLTKKQNTQDLLITMYD